MGYGTALAAVTMVAAYRQRRLSNAYNALNNNQHKGNNMATKQPRLKALQASASNKALYEQVAIRPDHLEWFKNPLVDEKNKAGALGAMNTAGIWEHIIVPEFTCLCPITGQPDFATIEIFYSPDERCVESKALKIYLGSFRNVGTFHEAATTRVATDLQELLDPLWLLVVGKFTPRGGIPFHPRVAIRDVPEALLYRV